MRDEKYPIGTVFMLRYGRICIALSAPHIVQFRRDGGIYFIVDRALFPNGEVCDVVTFASRVTFVE